MDWLLELTDKNGDLALNVLHEIEEQISGEIKKSVSKITEVQNNVTFITSLKGEYNEYIACVEQESSTSEIVRRVNNYLNTYKSYLNQWDKYIINKNKDLETYYKDAISKIYDSYFEYRFIYNLRNYASHGGHPISTINQSFERGTEIKLNRESFIEKYKKMQAPFRKELEKMEVAELDVDNAIRVTHDNLLHFHQQMINKVLNSSDEEYLRASVAIVKFQKKYNKEGGNIAVTTQETIDNIRRMHTEPSQAEISYIELPLLAAKTIIKGVQMKFKFKGTYMGTSPDFPFIKSESLLVAMPKFYEGQKYVNRNGINWVKVTQSLGMHWKDGYSRYFAIYMPEGLTTREYEEEIKKYKLEVDKLFSRNR